MTPSRCPAYQALSVAALLLLVTGDAAAQLKTLVTNYTVKMSVQSANGPLEHASTEVGTFRYDAANGRAVYSRLSTTAAGDKWKNQELYDSDTSLSVSWRASDSQDTNASGGARHSSDKAISGRPEQTVDDWWRFLGAHRLSVVTGHVAIGNEGRRIEDILDDAAEVDPAAAPQGGGNMVGQYRVNIVRDSQHDNRLEKISWSHISPGELPKDAAVATSADITVKTSVSVSGVWIPTAFTWTESRRGGSVKLPGNLRVGRINPADGRATTTNEVEVPAKVFVAEVELSDPQVNVELSAAQFAADAENGHPVTNWDAPHIEHVLVNNKILPKVDAVAAGLVKTATFSRSSGVKTNVVLVNVAILVVIAGAVMLRRYIAARSTLSVLGVFCTLISGTWAADGDARAIRTQARGPYCGVYSVAAALNAVRLSASPESMLHKRYISSYRGSTGADLCKLVTDCRGRAEVVSGLSLEHLRCVDRPVVLHFRSASQLESYDHWVTFLGVENDQPRIYDPPERVGPLSWAEVSSRWDGVGIIISTRDSPAADVRYASVLVFAKSMAVVFPACALMWLVQCWPLRGVVLRGRAAFPLYVGLVSISMVVGQCISPVGLACNPRVVDRIGRAYFPQNVREISRDEMVKAVDEGRSCIIDARLEADFAKGSIPGALSMAIDSALPYREALLQGIGKKTPIVVFCESKGCMFADSVAQYVSENGYDDVSIFRAGYREWVK